MPWIGIITSILRKKLMKESRVIPPAIPTTPLIIAVSTVAKKREARRMELKFSPF